jgi:hypothetical protein
MDGWTIGADIATILTGLSVLTATIVWVRKQWGEFRTQQVERRYRNWHGFIMLEAVDTWYVRLAEQPDMPPGRVALDVLQTKDGEPDSQLAQGLRINVQRDGMLSRSPTPAEFDFLKDMRKERGYGKGYLIR